MNCKTHFWQISLGLPLANLSNPLTFKSQLCSAENLSSSLRSSLQSHPDRPLVTSTETPLASIFDFPLYFLTHRLVQTASQKVRKELAVTFKGWGTEEKKQCWDRIGCVSTERSTSNVYYSKRRNGWIAMSLPLKGFGACSQGNVNKQASKCYFPSFLHDFRSVIPQKLSYQTYLAHLCW